jgi:hypothetical protein
MDRCTNAATAIRLAQNNKNSIPTSKCGCFKYFLLPAPNHRRWTFDQAMYVPIQVANESTNRTTSSNGDNGWDFLCNWGGDTSDQVTNPNCSGPVDFYRATVELASRLK